MIKLPPSLKIILTFVSSFLLLFFFINFSTQKINEREEAIHNEGAKILQQEVGQKFQMALDVTWVIGQMSTVYIEQIKDDQGRYKELLREVLKDKNYILGINQLNAEGRVIHIYPEEGNQEALGKISQKYDDIRESLRRGEQFWFSPPVKLLQGLQPGFAFYIPIIIKNKLRGWIVPVLLSDAFFAQFKKSDFLNKYDIAIKDAETGASYFETGMTPKSEEIKELVTPLWGRNIVIKSWPKATNSKFELSFWIRFLISFFFGFFCALFMKIHLQKKKAYMRLDDISDVLKITSNEVLAKLMDIQAKFLAEEGKSSSAEHDIQTANNLIEQIELLQNIAASDHFYEETFEILPLMKEHIEHLRDIVSRKNVVLNLDTESFKDIKLTANKWLVSNTVIKNAISFSALVSHPDSKIEVTHTVSPTQCCTIFYIEKVIEESLSKTFRVDRRLLVAQNVMNLMNGEITLREDGSGGMILKLSTMKI